MIKIGLIVGFLAVLVAILFLRGDNSKSPEPVPRPVSLQPERIEGKSEPACDSGLVSLGPERGAIDFDVSCGPGNSGQGRFVVTRYNSKGNQSKSGIRRVVVAPRDPKRGRANPRTRCDLWEEGIVCTSSHHDRHEVRGRLWVQPGEECAKDVSIYVVRPARCHEGVCRLSLRLKYLAKGRPGGC